MTVCVEIPDGSVRVAGNPLIIHAAEHHCPEPAIAQRCRFREVCGSGVEPNHRFRGLGSRDKGLRNKPIVLVAHLQLERYNSKPETPACVARK